MKNYSLFIILSSLITLQLASAQSGQVQDSSAADGAVFKTHALQFQISDRLRLTAFQGALLSYKFHHSDSWALRIGLGMDVEDSKTERDSRNFSEIDTLLGEQTRTTDYYLFILQSQFLYYFNTTSDIKTFIGTGPYLTYRNRILEDEDNKLNLSEEVRRIKETKYREFRAGLSFASGAEWLFRKNMSVTAEYGFLIYYQSSKDKMRGVIYRETDTSEDEVDYNVNRWVFSASSVKFGLTIYL